MTKKNRPDTYNRIINASLVLFNEQGERNISTNHIAAFLGISPGNLYYHFANKDEIIIQLFKRYSTELLNYLHEAPLPHNTADMSNYMMDLFDIMWQYRFLFSDVNALLSRSAELLGEHNEFTHAKISPLLLKLLADMTEHGLINTDETARHELALNIWIMAKYWFDFDSSMHAHELTDTSKYRGTRQILSLFRPYICAKHRTELTQVMNRLAGTYLD